MKRGLLIVVGCWLMVVGYANDTLTRAQVYNFNVGDTFDYEGTITSDPPGWPFNGTGYERKVVADKYYSSNFDTLFILRNTIYPSFFSETLVLSNLNDYEIYLDSMAWCFSNTFSVDTNSIYNGRTVNGVYVSCGEPSFIDSFADGLGLIYNSHY